MGMGLVYEVGMALDSSSRSFANELFQPVCPAAFWVLVACRHGRDGFAFSGAPSLGIHGRLVASIFGGHVLGRGGWPDTHKTRLLFLWPNYPAVAVTFKNCTQ